VRAQQGSFVLTHQNRRRKQAGFENPAFAEALHGASADRLARFQHTFAAGWAPSRFSQVAAVFARLSAPSSRE